MKNNSFKYSAKFHFAWKTAIPIFSINSWKLIPNTDQKPGIYRWKIVKANGLTSYYIGEAVNLRRRIRQYCFPGPTQQTSIRINKLLKSELKKRSKISLEFLVLHKLNFGKHILTEIDLSCKHVRLLIENLVLLEHRGQNIHNL